MAKLNFEEWCARENLPPAPPPQPAPEFVCDPVATWRAAADAAAEERVAARAARKAEEARIARTHHVHEVRLAKAANNGDVDLAAILNTLADALAALDERLTAVEDALGLNGKRAKHKHKPSSSLQSKPVDLPRFLAPKYGPSLGWGSDVQFSQPIETVRS